jgi:hypothetical protein
MEDGCAGGGGGGVVGVASSPLPSSSEIFFEDSMDSSSEPSLLSPGTAVTSMRGSEKMISISRSINEKI